eukprot:381463_1
MGNDFPSSLFPENSDSSYILLELDPNEINKISSLCTSSEQCIIPSKYDESKYEIKALKEACLECTIHTLVHTQYFKNIIYCINSVCKFDRYQELKAQMTIKNCFHNVCSTISNMLQHPEIRICISRNKIAVQMLFTILCSQYSCLRTHPKCPLYIALARGILFGRNKRCLKWFVKLNDGNYFKYLVIDQFEEMQSELSNISDITQVNDEHFWTWLNIVYNLWRHQQYVINSLDKYKHKNALQYILNVLKIYEEIRRTWNSSHSVDTEIVSDCYVRYGMDITCRNKRCDSKYLKYKFYKCKGCKAVYYCSRHCQKYDWNRFGHKQICNDFFPNND